MVFATPVPPPAAAGMERSSQFPVRNFLATAQTNRFHRVEARQRSGLPGAKRMPAGRRPVFGFLYVALTRICEEGKPIVGPPPEDEQRHQDKAAHQQRVQGCHIEVIAGEDGLLAAEKGD